MDLDYDEFLVFCIKLVELFMWCLVLNVKPASSVGAIGNNFGLMNWFVMTALCRFFLYNYFERILRVLAADAALYFCRSFSLLWWMFAWLKSFREPVAVATLDIELYDCWQVAFSPGLLSPCKMWLSCSAFCIFVAKCILVLWFYFLLDIHWVEDGKTVDRLFDCFIFCNNIDQKRNNNKFDNFIFIF